MEFLQEGERVFEGLFKWDFIVRKSCLTQMLKVKAKGKQNCSLLVSNGWQNEQREEQMREMAGLKHQCSSKVMRHHRES